MTDRIVTLHARAEAWECDFNGHWNTRYFCRAFGMASDVAARRSRQSAPLPHTWHLRFHAEVLAGDPITISSFDASGGKGVVHIMSRDGQTVATALALGAMAADLPGLPKELVAQAMPRGLDGPAQKNWEADAEIDVMCELGPVQGSEIDRGTIAFWCGVARMSHASHHFDIDLGFTPARLRQNGIGRMLAELRFTTFQPCQEGDLLRSASRLEGGGGKAFRTSHMLMAGPGTPVAMIELCSLATDMTTRRAIALPDFVTRRLG